MERIDLRRHTSIPPRAGTLLISEPFLSDPGFARTVVFLCEHGPEGTVGFILNKPADLDAAELMSGLNVGSLRIFDGGPVQKDTLHMIHKLPDELGGIEIAPGVYWGGSYERLAGLLKEQQIDSSNYRLFIGYSGWSGGQLQTELEGGSWFVLPFSSELLFSQDESATWEQSIKMLGAEFAHYAHMPRHPQLN